MKKRKALQLLNYLCFEPRQFLAGDVRVAFNDGSLLISGDEQANEVSIISSTEQGTRAIPANGTTVNGSSSPFPIQGVVQRFDVAMGSGDDRLTISGLVVLRELFVNGGDGNDRLQVSDVNARAFDVNGGNGNDVLQFHNAFSRQHIHIDDSSGDNTIAISAMAAERNLRIRTGSGADVLGIDDLGVRNRIDIETGGGDDTVFATGRVYAHKAVIRLGDGDDTLGVLPQLSGDAIRSVFQRRLAVDSGAGNDQVFLAEDTFAFKKASFDGAGGNDSIGTANATLRRRKASRFENQQLANVDRALDAFYSRLSNLGIDSSPFGGDAQNSAPVLTLTTGSLTIPQDAGPVSVDNQLTLAGRDGTTVSGATVTVVDSVAARDVLALPGSGSIAGTFNASTGVLSLSGTGTLEQYQAALRTVTYDDTRNPSVTGTRRVEFTVSTSQGTATGARTLNVLGLEAPVLNVNDAELPLTRSASATDVDNQLTLSGTGFNATGATVRVTNYVQVDDVLTATATGSITRNFDEATGILTFSGTASMADYQAALRTVKFDNSSSTFTGLKTVEFVVNTERGEVRDRRLVRILTDQEAIDSFAATNSLTLQRTASGLNYIIETPGNSVFPTANSSVRVKYRGTLLDGRQFDTNDNALFPLQTVIEGFREGLLLFSEGAIGEILIPSSIGYKEAGTANIPPNSVLRFEIELLKVI